jgi:hypothetical protein
MKIQSNFAAFSLKALFILLHVIPGFTVATKCNAQSVAGILNDTIVSMNEKGRALKKYYLDLRVEELWISGQHINWETGEPDGSPSDQDIHTHCSAFVAAACKRLNIYLLRPPDHKMQLLANAQYDWLNSPDAGKNGWKAIMAGNNYEEVQQYANKGFVVIAVIKNRDSQLPGHIALVRPAEISKEKLAESGPMLIMAGTHNFNYISLKSAFKSHISGWPSQEVLFYFNISILNF